MVRKEEIGELGEIKSGLSSYYLKNQEKDGKEIFLVNVKDIKDGRIDLNSVDNIKVRETDAIEKARVCEGDLILSTVGNFKAAVADESVNGFVISANLTAITLSDKVIPEVVAAYLNSPAGQNELNKRAGGGTTVGLNKKQLKNVEIPVAELELQKNLQRFIELGQEYSRLLSEEAEIWNNIVDAIVVEKLDA